MEAITREEKIMSGENLTPITRKEMFLAKAAGMDVETPEPITREEMFLSKIAGGGNAGGGDTTENKLAKVVNRTITELTAKDLEGATKIGTYAFRSCASLIDAEVPYGVTIIEGYAFAYCNNLTNIVLPDSMRVIQGEAFYYCEKLNGVIIPDGVNSIGSSAFSNCKSLTSINIPDGITIIVGYTFSNCTAMQEYDFSKCTSVPTLAGTNAFTGIPSTCIMKIPAALFDEWKAATNWSNFADYMVAV